ncbi:MULTISPECIES: phosphatase PAP2 family protein [Rhodococcus]|uniref:phosphatase PAP2 family protein n=1 Tax=Rhodococcus TaxID=1827 RepID=UPI0007181925|nr:MULTISPECIES: phosphatase PAP2 family protein [Rhodococcus]MEA1798296.1 phosphatase PAP2 family protein [Rhodococcus qingshengii]
MSGTLDTVRVLVTEIRTESATAEVALWTISISVAAYVGAVGAGRKARARGADALSAAHGWGAMRFAALSTMFALVTVQVHSQGWLTGADAATLDWSLAHQFGGLTSVAVVITEVATPVGLAVIAVATAALVSWRRRSWAPGMLIVGTVVAAAAASTLTTMIVRRSRPEAAAELVTGVDWTYPSGHVTGIVALAGALWVVYGARVRTTSVRVGVGAAVVFVVTVVAGAGLYLGVCWLTDVFAGVLLGAAVATAASVVAEVFTIRRLPAAFVPADDLLLRTITHRPCPGESGYRTVKSGGWPRTSAGIDQVISCQNS